MYKVSNIHITKMHINIITKCTNQTTSFINPVLASCIHSITSLQLVTIWINYNMHYILSTIYINLAKLDYIMNNSTLSSALESVRLLSLSIDGLVGELVSHKCQITQPKFWLPTGYGLTTWFKYWFIYT